MSNAIRPVDLQGPRSYFTDFDYRDKNSTSINTLRKLKIQLLTKQQIVIAASSLFHEQTHALFREDSGLTKALSQNIVLPAIREEFQGVSGFFDKKLSSGYTPSARSFFIENTNSFVPWKLRENTEWFHATFSKVLTNELPIRLKLIGVEEDALMKLNNSLDELLIKKPLSDRFLSREDITTAAKSMPDTDRDLIESLSNLLYRLSGARVVNSEGHFPQSNLTDIEIVGNESLLNENRIFWDLYIETMATYLSSPARLSPESLDKLSFLDILKIREGFFDADFAKTYDHLMALAKKDVALHDPEELLMTQEEISIISERLQNLLALRISGEIRNPKDRTSELIQLGSLIEKGSDYFLFGALKIAKAVPEITSLFSTKLSKQISDRAYTVKRYVEVKTNWNPRQRKAFLSAYSKLLSFGIPKL